MAANTRTTPPRKTPPPPKPPATPQVTPSKDGFLELLLYALPRLSDLLRRITDIKNSAASKRLRMSPAVALWLSLALVGLVISANSYFVGFQSWQPDAETITTVIPVGRDDIAFRPMALFPPLLLWVSKVVNFSMWLVGLLIPDIPLTNGASPQWTPTLRPTVWSSATLALAWWVGAFGSILISSTQGLFTRSVPLGKQREYAVRLNKISKIDLNPKAIAPAKREVRKANNYGRTAIWGMFIVAVAGWGWEFFVANGALDGTSFDQTARWIYGLASTFMAELCWAIADFSSHKIDPDL